MKIFVCLFLLVALFASVPAASDDKAVLRAMLDEFLAGAGRNDVAIHDRFWAEDLIYTGSSGRRTSKADIINSLRTPAARQADQASTTYSAEDVRINLYGNAAIVAFRLVAVSKNKEGKESVQNYFNTGTFIKRNDEWRAVAWQATSIPRE